MINDSNSMKLLPLQSFDNKKGILNSIEINNKENGIESIITNNKQQNFELALLNYQQQILNYSYIANLILYNHINYINSYNCNYNLYNNYFFNNNSIIKNEGKTIKCEETKKRNLFRITHPDKFIIFNPGDYDHSIRQFINKIISEEKKSKTPSFSKEKRRKTILYRKYNADNIRKKIKSRFLKSLKNTINYKLKLAGSKKTFNFLQYKFGSNVTKKINKEVLNLTFKEIISKNFCDSEKEDDVNMKKYYDNLSVLKYLERKTEICEKSNYNIFKDMKYYEIFEEYLNSKEFEIEIGNLRKEKLNDNDKYIQKYIKLAYGLNDFFSK